MPGISYLGDNGGPSLLGAALDAAVQKAMDDAGGHVKTAAAALGVSYSALYRWLREGRVRWERPQPAMVTESTSSDAASEAAEEATCQEATQMTEPK